MRLGFLRLDDRSLYEGDRVSILEPLGLEYLISNLENDHDIYVCDLNVGDKFDYDKILDFLCITIPTPLYNQAKKIIAKIKKRRPETIVLAGGPHPSALPIESVYDLGADCAIIGEGEMPLNKILDTGHEEWRRIVGTKINYSVEDIDRIKYPSRDHFDKTKYKLDLPNHDQQLLASVITSRSCPYECTFCSSKRIFGNKLRMRSVENIMAELRELKAKGYDTLIFLDDTFTFNRSRIMDLCEQMINEGLRFKWWVDTRVDRIDYLLLAKMKEAGCACVVYGIESGNGEVLRRIKKNITLAQAKKAVTWTKEVGIECKANFILGHLHESEKQIIDTINFAKGLQADKTSFYINLPLPGTDLFIHSRILKTSEYDRFKWYGSTVPSISLVSSERLKELQQIAYEEMKNG